jgi:tetratricopeptide (TPR) repeat protein
MRAPSMNGSFPPAPSGRAAPFGRRTRFRGVVALIVLSVGAGPRVAWGQGKDQAAATAEADGDAKRFNELMRAGIAEYRKGNREAAREAFSQAWAIKPTKELAASLAEIEMALGRFHDAALHWEFYIQNLPPDRAAAEKQLEECRRHLGSIEVSVDTPGATVLLDGKALGPAPLRVPIWVEPGMHAVSARLNDELVKEQQVSVAAGEVRSVALRFAGAESGSRPAEPAPAARVQADTTPDAGGVSGRTLFLIGGSVLTVAAAGIGVGFTLKGNAAHDDAEALRNQIVGPEAGAGSASLCSLPPSERPASCDDYLGKLDERDQARNIALGSFIAAGALGAGTVLGYVFWPKAKPANKGAGLSVSPVASRGAYGAQVDLRF